MVKLGFIGEGATEKIILESKSFRQFLISHNISFIENVIDATGNGNLLPKNIAGFVNRLKDEGATIIIILTDLDEDKCISLTKERIDPEGKHIVLVSVKEIESWFLSDIKTMRSFFSDDQFIFNQPENISDPFSEIRALRIQKTGRGLVTKKTLANLMVYKSGFSIIEAAKHPDCSSAKYFLDKILSFSTK